MKTGLLATIHAVKVDPNYDFGHVIAFSVYDGEDTAMVSFHSEISTAHASFLDGHILRYDDQCAYTQMIRAITAAEDPNTLIDQEFVSTD